MLWNGDVWKAIVDLRQDKNIDIYTCEMDQGIGVIQKKENTKILKIDKNIKKLKFKDFYKNYKESFSKCIKKIFIFYVVINFRPHPMPISTFIKFESYIR